MVLSAQDIDPYPNYVVIGAFVSEDNADFWTKEANTNSYTAHFEINPNRNLFYVYVMTTADRGLAFREALKLRMETKYFDTWVYSGVLGKDGLANPLQQNQDFNPATQEQIASIPPEQTSPPEKSDGNIIGKEIALDAPPLGAIQDPSPGNEGQRNKKSNRKKNKNARAESELVNTIAPQNSSILADGVTETANQESASGKEKNSELENAQGLASGNPGDQTGDRKNGEVKIAGEQNIKTTAGDQFTSTNKSPVTKEGQTVGQNGEVAGVNGQNLTSTAGDKSTATTKNPGTKTGEVVGQNNEVTGVSGQNAGATTGDKSTSTNKKATTKTGQVAGQNEDVTAVNGQNLTSTAGDKSTTTKNPGTKTGEVVGQNGKLTGVSGQNAATTSGDKSTTTNKNATTKTGQVAGQNAEVTTVSGQKQTSTTGNKSTATTKIPGTKTGQVVGQNGPVAGVSGQNPATTSEDKSIATNKSTGTKTGLVAAPNEGVTGVSGPNPALKTNEQTAILIDTAHARVNEEPLTSEDVVGKNFYFKLFRASNNAVVEGDVDAIDFEKSRLMATYKGNNPVKVLMPAGKSKQVSFVCEVFGYRKLQKEFDPAGPSEEFYLDEDGNLVLPFELIRLQKGDIAIMYNVFFFKDAGVMRPESRYEVNNLLELLNENPSYKIVIHGHTNGNAAGKIISMGSTENYYSLTGTKEGFGTAKNLSEERALVMKKYLISKGVDAERMDIQAWGGKKPIHDKHAVRANENVRVEIEILSD